MITINQTLPYIYRQDKQVPPLALDCSGFSKNVLWEATGNDNEFAGTFSPRAGKDTIQPYTSFTPANRTQTLTLKVYDASMPSGSWTNITSGVAFDFANDEVTYNSGPSGYHGATGTDVCASGDCFIETCVKGAFYNRGFGRRQRRTVTRGIRPTSISRSR